MIASLLSNYTDNTNTDQDAIKDGNEELTKCYRVTQLLNSEAGNPNPGLPSKS